MSLRAYLERLEPAQNVARFYRVEIVGDLFDQVAVLRSWGRIGSPRGQELRSFHPDQLAAELEASRVAARKRRKGYQDGPCRPSALPRPPKPVPGAPGPLLAFLRSC